MSCIYYVLNLCCINCIYIYIYMLYVMFADIVEDGLIDLWTDGKMTVEALVEQEFSRRSDPCQEQ